MRKCGEYDGNWRYPMKMREMRISMTDYGNEKIRKCYENERNGNNRKKMRT